MLSDLKLIFKASTTVALKEGSFFSKKVPYVSDDKNICKN